MSLLHVSLETHTECSNYADLLNLILKNALYLEPLVSLQISSVDGN